MLKKIKLSLIKKRAIENLDTLKMKIEQQKEEQIWITKEFTFKDDLNVIVDSIARENNKNRFLYVFTADSTKTIYEKYRLRKRGELKVSRINDFDEGKTQCLYVGSGRNCRSRLRQHLGLTAKSNGTYSLHLKKVLGAKSDNIIFCIYVLPLGNDIDQAILQSLEDSLWRMLEPCFGKFGGK